MHKFQNIQAAFLNGRDKVKDLKGLRKLVAETLPGFGMSLKWPAQSNTALGAVNLMIEPPVTHVSFSPVYIIGKDENDLVKKALTSVPRLLRDLAENETTLEENYEFVYQKKPSETVISSMGGKVEAVKATRRRGAARQVSAVG